MSAPAPPTKNQSEAALAAVIGQAALAVVVTGRADLVARGEVRDLMVVMVITVHRAAAQAASAVVVTGRADLVVRGEVRDLMVVMGITVHRAAARAASAAIDRLVAPEEALAVLAPEDLAAAAEQVLPRPLWKEEARRRNLLRPRNPPRIPVRKKNSKWRKSSSRQKRK